MISPPEQIALLSLPMLSLMRVAHRLRGAALGVIGALIPESGNALPPGRIQYTSEAQRYVLPGVRGRLGLLGGMVRVNRLWQRHPAGHPSRGAAPRRGVHPAVDRRAGRLAGRLAGRRPRTVGPSARRDRPAAGPPVQPRHRDHRVHRHRLPVRHAVRARSCHRGVPAHTGVVAPGLTTSPSPGSSSPWEPSAVRWAPAGRTSVWWAGPRTKIDQEVELKPIQLSFAPATRPAPWRPGATSPSVPSASPAPRTSPPHSGPTPATRNGRSPSSASHDHEPDIMRLRRSPGACRSITLRFSWAVGS